MYLFTLVAAILLPTLTLSLPVPAPLQASEYSTSDFAVNVLFVSASVQFGMWIPHDGVQYATSGLTCLDMPAAAYGACSLPTVDDIGVVAGNGPCRFWGEAGYYNEIAGDAGEGFYSVGPPQRIMTVSCGP